MSKIINPKMKGRKLNSSFGKFEFDTEGITEVTDEQAEILITLGDYRLLEEDGKSGQSDEIPPTLDKSLEEEKKQQEEDEGTPPEDKNETSESEDDERLQSEVFTEDDLVKMNVPQLKKIAKDNGIDLNGATKKDEIVPIILGAINE